LNFNKKESLIKTNKIKYWQLLFFGGFFCLTLGVWGQNQAQPNNKKAKSEQQKKQQKKKADSKKSGRTSSPIREEIQRYFGYETLLFRYLNLPYDATFNTNVAGPHIEGGFLLLLFFPILIFLGFRRKPLWGIVVVLGCFGLLLISIPHSFIYNNNLQSVPANATALNAYLNTTSFDDAPISISLAYFYKTILPIYEPINNLVNGFSGNADYVTYPLLMVLFVLGFLFIQYRLQYKSLSEKAIANVVFFYSYLWFLMAAGIIWYGYLILPMSILFIVGTLTYLSKQDGLYNLALKIFLVVGLIWLTMGHVVRTSNVNKIANDASSKSMVGKRLFDEPMVLYQTGDLNTKEVFEKYLPNVTTAISTINSDESKLVYRAGTSLPFFITKNDDRVFSDNLLSFFITMVKKYQINSTIADVLKANNYEYIIVNLNLASIDRTPEKTLQRKFVTFMTFLENTDNIELLATDRLLKVQGPNNTLQYQYGIEGEIQVSGTYAVYRIN